MDTTLLKRKQRIAQERKERKSVRNKKWVVASIAGTIGAFALFNGKVGACSINYTVKKDDNLYRLSKKHQVSVEQLMVANGLTTDKIIVGQQLLVPGDSVAPLKEKYAYQHTVQKGDSLYHLSKIYRTTVTDLKKENQFVQDHIKIGQKIRVPKEIYTVTPGDTLWGISERFGVKLEDMIKENKLNHKMVLIGQKLTIPGSLDFSKAEIVGAADNFTVEFDQNGEPLVLKVPYGTATDYQNKSGQKVTVIHKNGSVITVY
ncbi:LysM peptidoglycan-binding domain-containing protein [Pseudoneobacillus sp. C159]